MRGVLLDVDGVLIDSLPAYQAVWEKWAPRHGLDPTYAGRAMLGRWEDALGDLLPHADVAAEIQILIALLDQTESRIAAFAGAAALLSGLEAGSWAIVTAGPRERVVQRFARLELPFPAVSVCGEDVTAHKPDPSCYLIAAEQLGIPAGECIALEDSPAGMAAARAAGCHVLGLSTTVPAADCAAAHELFDDLAQASVRLDELLEPAVEDPYDRETRSVE